MKVSWLGSLWDSFCSYLAVMGTSWQWVTPCACKQGRRHLALPRPFPTPWCGTLGMRLSPWCSWRIWHTNKAWVSRKHACHPPPPRTGTLWLLLVFHAWHLWHWILPCKQHCSIVKYMCYSENYRGVPRDPPSGPHLVIFMFSCWFCCFRVCEVKSSTLRFLVLQTSLVCDLEPAVITQRFSGMTKY